MTRRHKWGAKATVVDNIRFDSKREAAVYVELRTLLRAGKIKKLTLQPAFLLQPAYEKDGKIVREIDYVADFLIEWTAVRADKKMQLIDVKGCQTAEYKLKKKLFHFQYPQWTIEEWR